MALAILAIIGCCGSPQALADGPVICIIDSGANVAGAAGWNYLADNEDLTDLTGHGTAVYSLVSQTGADVYMLKCFDDNQSAEQSVLSCALTDAVDKWHASIICISWITNNEHADELHEAVHYAQSQNAVILAAAGNLNLFSPVGAVTYPAAWDEVIGVGGVDIDVNGCISSSYWYAQGTHIFVSANGIYGDLKGSSFAVPRVAEVVWRFLSKEPDASDKEIRDYLMNIAIDEGVAGYDTVFGWGVIP